MAVADEFTPLAKFDYVRVVRGIVFVMGFDSDVDDLPSVDAKDFAAAPAVAI